MRRSPATIAAALAGLVALVLVACEPTASSPASGGPSAAPSGTPSGAPSGAPSGGHSSAPAATSSAAPVANPIDGVNVACIGIVADECRQVAERVLAELPDDRGRPFSIAIQAYGCEGSPCLASLGDAGGLVTVEYVDPGEPIVRTLLGPIASLGFGASEMAWSGLQQPASERVDGQGPFPHELGHCGLLWKVDFDGSFWLPVGEVDGNASALVNADQGTMLLVDPNRAIFTDASGAAVNLVRHPGQKHVWLCR